MSNWLNQTHIGDCRTLLGQMAADGVRVQTCVTSPPYFGLRDYGVDGQIGLEQTPAEFVGAMVSVFRAVREVLADDGTLWLNLGDSYASGGRTSYSASGKNTACRIQRPLTPAGMKPKDLLGIPWRVAFALQDDGWYLRSDIIWHKPTAMPESVTDRPTKSHEYVFLLSKRERYFYDADAIKEVGCMHRSGNTQHKYVNGQQMHRTKAGFMDMRQTVYERVNARTVWTIPAEPFGGAHFACFPQALVTRCVLAGAHPGDTVLDPFMGSGTVAQVATDLGRHFIGCELNPEYVELHEMRRTTVGMPW